MNQFMKMVFRGECDFIKKTGRNLMEQMLTVPSSSPLRMVSTCSIVFESRIRGQYDRNNYFIYFKTFSTSSRWDNKGRITIVPKTINIIGEKRRRTKEVKDIYTKIREDKNNVDNNNLVSNPRLYALRTTRKKIREKGKSLIKDIKETKEKMKEKIEGVIEKENIYTIPNLLCITRIGLSPYLGYLIVTEKFQYALVFLLIAGISDWVDGYIARNFKSQSSKIGSFLDPMADKVLIGTLFITLTYIGQIPGYLTALVIGKDVVLIIAGFVIRYLSLPKPRTLSRYFDVTYPTAQLAPTFISKVNTGIQLLLVATSLAAPTFGFADHPYQYVLWNITAASTVLAAGSYIISKETYKFLRHQGSSNKKKSS